MKRQNSRFVVSDLVKPESLDFSIPGESSKKIVKLLRGIPESGNIFAKHDDHIRTDFLRIVSTLNGARQTSLVLSLASVIS